MIPSRLVAAFPADVSRCELVAKYATEEARRLAPKLSVASAGRISPIWGDGWVGLKWEDSHLWFQNQGIRPFTMTSVAGKTVPMWVDDPTGTTLAANPKAKTRTTASGKRQVLIFLRAAPIGARRMERRGGRTVSVPRSYPGAPGRIINREVGQPWTRESQRGGAVARPNTGVRWRHPGLAPRLFLEEGLRRAADREGLALGPIQVQV